jgi:hypothetical protein
MYKNTIKSIDFSEYTHIYCDSTEALEWAYISGLPKTTIVYTSSPAVLCIKQKNIIHIESNWTKDNLESFQTTINVFSKKLYDLLNNIKQLSNEEILVIIQSFSLFQRVIYKASCLSSFHLNDKSLIINIDAKGGTKGFQENFMNQPWSLLFKDNEMTDVYDYKLKNEVNVEHKTKLSRVKLGGIETFIYRIANAITRKVPEKYLRKKVIVGNENELIIETIASMIPNGIYPYKLQTDKVIYDKDYDLDIFFNEIEETVTKRINSWVIPELVGNCLELFKETLIDNLSLFGKFYEEFHLELNKTNLSKSTLFLNSTNSIKISALIKASRENGIPVISMQHGVSQEINAFHDAFMPAYEINSSDTFIAFNEESQKTSFDSFYAKGNVFVSGISNRHLRVNSLQSKRKFPIVYVSNNLYSGNIGSVGNWLTDFDQCNNEIDFIKHVLAKIPKNVAYKTYPESRKRYADEDPALYELSKYKNINVIKEKVDMRYLLSDYCVLMSTTASSTLAWLLMTDKPLIFLHRSTHAAFKKGFIDIFEESVFFFDTDSPNCYEDIVELCSQPLNKINSLWNEKKSKRQEMIKQYITSFSGGAGKRIAKMIIEKHYL